jgi:hypothetical protein
MRNIQPCALDQLADKLFPNDDLMFAWLIAYQVDWSIFEVFKIGILLWKNPTENTMNVILVIFWYDNQEWLLKAMSGLHSLSYISPGRSYELGNLSLGSNAYYIVKKQ